MTNYKSFFICGIIAPLWLLIGVSITSAFYPGYSHLNQVLSELGAVGAPTHNLTPLLNHYPLAILFTLFGFSVYTRFKSSTPAKLSALLIIAHGLFTLLAGIFSCDRGCNPEAISTSQIIHNISGAIMFLSLTVANAIWIFISRSAIGSRWFSLFSLGCFIASLIALVLMINAMQSGSMIGLHQRLNYGFSALWIFGFGILLTIKSRDSEWTDSVGAY